MTRTRILAAVLLAALALPALAQSPCTLAQAGVKFKTAEGVVSEWWPKTTEQPTAGQVDVVGGNLSVALLVKKPTPAQIKAGVAPDALAFCLPWAKLSRGDELAVLLTFGGQPREVIRCRFETGDLYGERNYGTPVERLANVKPRVVPLGATTGQCIKPLATAEPPPVVVEPPVVTPPTGGTWVKVANEHQSFGFVGRVRFGLPGAWVEKVVDGYTMCNGTAEWFGSDPAPDQVKTCEALQL